MSSETQAVSASARNFPRNLVEHLRSLAAARPRDLALVVASREGDSRWDYRTLDLHVRALAAVLQERFAAGDRALLLLDNDAHYVVAFLACLHAGVVAVPLFRPESAREQHLARLTAIAADCEAAAVLTTGAIRDLLGVDVGVFGGAEILAVDAVDSARAARWSPHHPEEADLAFLQYTSGSTSTPKGVMVSHGNLMANERAIEERLGVGADDVFVSWLPLYHDMGLIGGLLQPLHRGIPVVLMSPSFFLERPVRWLEAIARHGGTISGGPDFAYRLCVERVKDAGLQSLDLSSWRVAFSGAEPVRHDTLRSFADRFESAGFHSAAVYPCYGLAEATLLVSGGQRGAGFVARDFDHASLADGQPRAVAAGVTLVACGVAASDHRIEIVDPETLVPLGHGRVGEIWAQGPSIAGGYWRRLEESALCFVDVAGVRWLRTGDLGFIDDGQLFVTGRIKDVIIVRGHNVYPQDIERCIEEQVDAVRSGRVAAFAVDTPNGEGLGVAAEVSRSMRRLVTPQVLVEALAEAVVHQCGERLSVLVLLNPGGLPKTSSGKLQRGACRQGWRDGTLDAYAVWENGRFAVGEALAESAPSPAGDGMALALAAIWREALPIDRGPEVAHELHFFKDGGNSLVATQVAAAISERWGVPFPVRLLFEHPRLADCAAALRRCLADGAREAQIPCLPPERRAGALPMSHAQERQWFLWRLDPEGAAYHVSFGLRLDGALDIMALHQALDAAVARHEALRTVFESGPESRPLQRILPAVRLELPVVDLLAVPADEREQRAAQEARRVQAAPMDLTRGPLLRAALLRLDAQTHVLVLVVHHIVSDGASVQRLVDEIAADYAAWVQGVPSRIAAPRCQYADFAVWQRDALLGGEGERQLAWWREQLGEHQPVLRLPGARRHADVGAARHVLDLPLDLCVRLRAAVGAHDATLFMGMLAGLQALLYRYTGQTDVRVGVPVANRERAETRHVIGLFVNTLVVSGRLDGRSTLAALLAQARTAMLGAQAHQDLPFEHLVAALQPARKPGESPLVQVVLNHLVEDFRALDALPGLLVTEYPLAEQAAQFELAVDVVERGHQVQVRFNYPRGRFDARTVERMGAHYLALLEVLAAQPQQTVGAVVLPGDVAEMPSEGRSDAAAQPVHRLIERQAQAQPDAPALILGDAVLSRAELNAAANRLAHVLMARGIGPDDRVGIALERSMQMAVAVLAVMKSGAAYVPLDSAYPPQRLAFMAQDSGIKALLTEQALRGRVPVPSAVHVLEVDGAGLAAQPSGDPEAAVHGAQLAYVIYTSGSTGRPKGVGVAHAVLSRHLAATNAWLRLTPDDRMLQFSTISFDGFVEQLLAPLVAGAVVVLRGPALWDSAMFLHELVARRISVADLPAAYWNLLAQDFARRGGIDRGVLRQMLVSGEAMPQQGLRAWHQAGLSSVRLLNLYGPTEAVVTATMHDCSGAEMAPDDWRAPIGRPLEGRRAHVVDADLNRVPAGVVGELCLGGPLLARGYLDRPGLSAERFVADPFDAGGGRMYRTGDLVRCNERGELEFMGRVDHQVKLRGLRVELGEVESQLLAQPEVREAVVVARAEATGLRLVGYVSLHAGQVADAAALRRRLGEALPEHMVPGAIVVLARLPLGVHGKVDRDALPAPQPAVDGPAEGPQGDLETALAQIWAETLQRPIGGRHDSFFELGGHSLLLLQVHGGIEARLGRKVAVVDLFKYPTVASLAAFLASAGGVEAPRVAQMEDRGRRQRGAFLSRKPAAERTPT